MLENKIISIFNYNVSPKYTTCNHLSCANDLVDFKLK